jgi:mRNA-degrading endonuclease RelE of RelBE toxin-antitoxin system
VYIIKFTDEGLQDVKDLPKHVKNSLKKELVEKVQRDPVGCAEELQGILAGWYSFHYYEYRVIYRIFDDLSAVSIAGIGRHDPDANVDIYRRLESVMQNGKLAESVLITLRGFTEPR